MRVGDSFRELLEVAPVGNAEKRDGVWKNRNSVCTLFQQGRHVRQELRLPHNAACEV